MILFKHCRNEKVLRASQGPDLLENVYLQLTYTLLRLQQE